MANRARRVGAKRNASELSDAMPRSHPSRRRLKRRRLLRMNGKWIATRQLTAHPEEAACSQRPSRRVPVTADVQRSLVLLARISILALFLCLVAVHRSAARTLEEALISTFPGALSEDARGLATVFSRTVAASFPVTGASAAYVYRFDPASDSFQRLNVPARAGVQRARRNRGKAQAQPRTQLHAGAVRHHLRSRLGQSHQQRPNAILPLNSEDLRSDLIIASGAEFVF
jgi:hypothetical protein